MQNTITDFILTNILTWAAACFLNCLLTELLLNTNMPPPFLEGAHVPSLVFEALAHCKTLLFHLSQIKQFNILEKYFPLFK